MIPICTICDAPWEPACEDHTWPAPLTELEAAAYARSARAFRRASSAPAARLAAAVARNPELAARYGITVTPGAAEPVQEGRVL